jgi:hypothetical protein
MALPYEWGWSDPRESAERFERQESLSAPDRWAERVESVEALLVDDGVDPRKAHAMARRIVEADVRPH